MRTGAIACCVLVPVLASVEAYAQTPPSDVGPSIGRPASDADVERSKELFSEGRRLVDAGNCKAGVPKLEESVRLAESIGARLSLAECAKGAPLEAWRHLKMAELLATKKGDDRLAFAHAQAAALERRLALIHVEVGPAVRDLAGFELRIDHAPVDPFFWRAGRIAVEPGRRVLEASARGKRRWTRDVDAGVGTEVIVDVPLEDEARTPAPTPASAPAPARTEEGSPRSDGSGQRTLGLATAGAGIVGVGVGAVFAVVASGKLADAKEACGTRYPTCLNDDRDAAAKNDSALASATVSTIAFVAGGLLLAGGAVLYFTAPRAAKTSVGLTPTIGGLDLFGTW